MRAQHDRDATADSLTHPRKPNPRWLTQVSPTRSPTDQPMHLNRFHSLTIMRTSSLTFLDKPNPGTGSCPSRSASRHSAERMATVTAPSPCRVQYETLLLAYTSGVEPPIVCCVFADHRSGGRPQPWPRTSCGAPRPSINMAYAILIELVCLPISESVFTPPALNSDVHPVHRRSLQH